VTDAPKIQFPCEYPIKVIADNHPSIRDTVLKIVAAHAPDIVEDSVSVKNSRAANYCSVRVTIVATGEGQLMAMHQALLQHSHVRLVL
jgi:putative lipoic acid-binding regulatory protein